MLLLLTYFAGAASGGTGPPHVGYGSGGHRFSSGSPPNPPSTTYAVTFTETGLPSGTLWYVNITRVAFGSSATTTITLNLPNGPYNYAIATVDKEYSSPGGSFTVNGAALPVAVPFAQVTYTVTFSESGLPRATSWSVTLNGVPESTVASTMAFSEPNGTYAYTLGVVPGWTTSSFQGSVPVRGAAVSVPTAWTLMTYPVTFTETGLPAGTLWYANVSGQASAASTTTAITSGVPNGTYSYTIATGDKEYSATGGSFIVNGAAPPPVSVTFILVTYAVTFTETGLPRGTNWSVALGTTMRSSTTTTILFTEPNGTYGYTIGVASGYTANPSSGNVLVAGASASQAVTFAQVPPGHYVVTFQETGLPAGVRWYANVTGEPSGSSTTSTITVILSNGTYSYAFASVNSSWAVVPATGSVTVSGGPVSVSAPFVPVYRVIVTAAGLPVGTLWYVNVTGTPLPQTRSGGAEPVSSASGPVTLSFSGTGSTIAFSLPNATWTYAVASANPSWAPVAPTGTLTVNGTSPPPVLMTFVVVYSVSFTESGLPAGAVWYLNVSGQTSVSSATTTVSVDLANGSYAYTVASANKNYATSAASGSFAVSGAAVSKSVSFTPYTYAVTFTEGGLPAGTTWYLNVTGQASVSSTATMASIPLANGTYAYVLASASPLYATSPAAGSFAIHGAPVAVTVTFSLVTYAVTFTEGGLPPGTTWYLNVTGQSSVSSTATTASVNLANGTYAYLLASANKLYATSPASGGITVSGAPVAQTVSFSLVTYAVTFTESGLPSGTSWSVTLGPTTKGSTTTTIIFTETNGTYAYTLGGVSGWTTSSFTGSVKVNGAGADVPVAWTPFTYAVTFAETGLPAGTEWYLNVSGQTSVSSATTTVSVDLANGSYAYTVASANKNYATSAASGSFAVSGAAVAKGVTYVVVTYAVTFTETGLPTGTNWSVTLSSTARSSSTTTITFSEANGTYAYAVGSVAGYTVSPASGNATVLGGSVTVTLTWTANPSSGGLGTAIYYAIGGVVVAGAVGVLVMVLRRRRR